MRNSYLKEIRNLWSHSRYPENLDVSELGLCDLRFFFGKNKVMAKALGSSAEDEVKENIHILSEKLRGNIGLLFSNCDPQETQR
jgi:mRNA turnover protein 4